MNLAAAAFDAPPALREAPMVDVAFALRGESLPLEHADALREAVEWVLPWLAADPRTGIHPLRVAPTEYGIALLTHRTRLLLRVAREYVRLALSLTGRTLGVQGAQLRVGTGIERPLRAAPTLYARQVAASCTTDAAFQGEIAQALAALDVRCGFITGQPVRLRAGAREVTGYSVLLHRLTADDSLRVQCAGVGRERRLGWGIFVPYKAIGAVE